MPKPHFVKKPIERIMEERISNLKSPKPRPQSPHSLNPDWDEELEAHDLVDIMRDLGDK